MGWPHWSGLGRMTTKGRLQALRKEYSELRLLKKQAEAAERAYREMEAKVAEDLDTLMEEEPKGDPSQPGNGLRLVQ